MTQPFIVMGANEGVGGKLAQLLEDDNFDTFLTAQDAGTLSSFKGQKHALNVMDSDAVKDVISAADQGEGIKGLSYCIGSIKLKPFGRLDLNEDILETFHLNVTGAIAALQAAEKGLKKANGSVVLFSTVAVQQGFSNHGAISSAKGAIEGLTRALAAEWAPKVRVNCIAPSLLDTGIAKPLTSSEQMAKGIAAMHPIPRLGEAEDVAHMAHYLLSDNASWVTGQIFHIDGGRSSLRVKG